MAEILEATMLICFGCSWPISVYKNIKAKSAKGMSLQFILLIVVGYIAGISAKIIHGTFNYVFIVYLLNLLMVSVNIVVYFINKRYDKKAELNPNITEEEKTMTVYTAELEKFKSLNTAAEEGGVVFLGGTYFAKMPIRELADDYGIETPVYNRSVKHLTLENMEDVLEPCVFTLNPKKIFLNLGESEVKNEELNLDNFIARYEWLLYTIHSRTKAQIYIVSIFSDSPMASKANERLKQLAKDSGYKYIDILPALRCPSTQLKVFDLLKFNLRTEPITFTKAMNLVSVG